MTGTSDSHSLVFATPGAVVRSCSVNSVSSTSSTVEQTDSPSKACKVSAPFVASRRKALGVETDTRTFVHPKTGKETTMRVENIGRESAAPSGDTLNVLCMDSSTTPAEDSPEGPHTLNVLCMDEGPAEVATVEVKAVLVDVSGELHTMRGAAASLTRALESLPDGLPSWLTGMLDRTGPGSLFTLLEGLAAGQNESESVARFIDNSGLRGVCSTLQGGANETFGQPNERGKETPPPPLNDTESRASQKKRVKNPEAEALITEVLEFWRAECDHPKAIIEGNSEVAKKRRKLVTRALKDCKARGMNKAEGMQWCMDAVSALASLDWNMGRDPHTNGKTYNEVSHVFGDLLKADDRVSQCRNRGNTPAPMATPSRPRDIQAANEQAAMDAIMWGN